MKKKFSIPSLILSLAGIILLPLALWLFFSVQKIMSPDFYAHGVLESEFLVNMIEETIQDTKSVPKAVKKNLFIARFEIQKTVRDYLIPQTRTQIRLFIDYLKGKDNFPPLQFETTLLKRNLVSTFKEAKKLQKIGDKMIVDITISVVRALPDVYDLGKNMDLESLKEWVSDNRKTIDFLLFARGGLLALLPVWYLLMFLVTWNIKLTNFRMRRICLTGGFFSLVFFGSVWTLAPILIRQFGPVLKEYLYFLSSLPGTTADKLTVYLGRTLALQGLFASGILLLSGGILIRKKKKTEPPPEPVRENIPAE